MAPNIDWTTMDTVAKGGTSMDDETIDKVVEDLRSVQESDFKTEPDKLIILFKSALNIFNHREQEFENLLEEQAVSETKKDEEIDDLKRRLEDEKRYGGAGAGGLRGDTEYLRAENRNLAELLEDYKEKERELVAEVEELQRDKQMFEREKQELRQNVKDLGMENKELREDVREFRNIMENQHREKLDVKGHIDSEMRDKLTEKNNQISDLIDQITQLEQLNKELEGKNRGVREEMETAQQDMEKMADEYEKMKRVIDGTDQYSENIQKDNQAYKLQVADLREQLRVKNEEVDAIVGTVNSKVEEWKTRLAEKDKQLVENARTIATLQDRISDAALDQDRIKVERLNKVLKEKEEQIKQLQTSLEQVINDLDAQTAIVQDLRKESGTNKEIIAYKNQIKSLQAKIKQLEDDVEDSDTHRLAADAEAKLKDEELNKALKRIDDIQSGEYGLAEAVHEIKECKTQIKVREQNIEELIKQVNQLEEKLNDILEENEELRERLGINPRDLSDIAKMRKSRALRQQQYRAENQILLKEIERLEDERIEMKQLIRSQAQTYTQRAVSEGLHQDDVELIEEFIEELKRKRKIGKPMQPKKFGLTGGGTLRQMNWRMDELHHQADRVEVDLQTSKTENAKLKQERNNYQKENTELKNAMKEILEAIKNSKQEGTSGPIEIQSLERLLHAIEVQNMRGEYDAGLHMKAQVDQLTGRNDELRRELRSTRTDLAAATGEKANLKSQNEVLRAEIATLSKLAEGKGGKTEIHTIPLPENIEPTSADIITALNEQLMQNMDDGSKRENRVKEITESLEHSRRKFNVLRHQTHLIYKEHFEEKKKWEAEQKRRDEERNNLQGQIEKDSVRLQELDRLLDSLERDPDTLKQRLAETTRKISLLRVNEKTLIRHHKALEFSEEQLQNENARLRKDIAQMEKAVAKRLGYLERYKDMAAYKIAALQKNLDGCVAESDLESLNRRYDELTAKYRDLLQKENQFVARNTKVETMQAEIKILHDEIEALRKELSIEKEKRHTLGEALSRAEGKENIGSMRSSRSLDKDAINYEISSVMKKVTVLEMKELNERQRAEHASRMYNQIKSTVDSIESRNAELEHKFAELTRMNLVSQKTERELRDELANAIPLSVSEADRKKILKLEEGAAKKRIRMSQLQDMTDIAQNQLKTLQLQQQGREREMRSLRQQVREFQVQSDDKSLIGKLHKQILGLQAVEADQKNKLEKTTTQVKKLEAHVLRQERMIDEKELMVFHIRTETTSRNRQLKRTIQSLRQQFSGALPLKQQEKFSESMIRLQGDKAAITEELKRVRREREQLEDQLAEAKIKEEGLQELKKTIKDGRGAQKLEEWCHKMDAMRLQDLKLQRQVVRQSDEIKYLEKAMAQHEKSIAAREEDIVEMLRNQEKQQLEWEQRETELERMIDDFDVRQREVVKKAKRLEDIPDLLPDPTLPLDVQLTRALKAVADQNVKQKDLLSKLRFYESDNDRLKNRIHVLEGDVFARDKIVNDLRLRIPDTTAVADVKIIKSELGMGSQSAKQLNVAMETIETLKKRLKQKEESIERYKKLLEDARRDLEHAVKQHENELSAMNRKLHSKTDDAFGRFRQAAMDAVAKKSGKPASTPQLAKLSELEELVQEQDVALTALMDRVKAANADIRKQKEITENLRRHADKERNRIFDEHEHTLRKLKDEISSKERSIDDLERELGKTKYDLHEEKEANSKAPSVTMKNLVSRLKTQLEEKDAQHKKLSQAITELRADLVHQAQENVRAANEGSNTNAAIHSLVQKKTEAYKEEVDELKDKVAMLQRGLKQERQKQDKLKTELKQVLDEAEKKQTQVNRLKGDKQKLDQENERLRDKIRRLGKNDEWGKGQTKPKPSGHDDDGSTSSGDDGDQDEPVKEEIIIPADARESEQPSSRPTSSKLPKSTVTYRFGGSADDRNAKIKQLEEENRRLKSELEKAATPSKNDIELAKWETKKLWQGRVDTLRNKLQEKEKNIQQLEKQIASLRDTVSRLERDKIRRVGGSGAPIHAVGQTSESAVVDKISRQEGHKIEELSKRLHDVNEENSKLRRENNLPRDIIVAEMEAKNKSLTERLEALEKEMTVKGARALKDTSVEQLYREREDKMKSEMLKLYTENAEMRFEVEQSKIDLPRLKDRVEDQQRYIELLRAEKREAELRADRVKIGQHKKGKEAGSTGKSPAELERMIGMLKKVVERVQRENETLKKAPGVISNEVMDGVRKENAQLKQKIEMMTRQIGGQLSSRYESKTLGVEKLMKENERLRKELTKESSAHEKVVASKASLQNLYEKQKTDIQNLKERLRSAENKAPRVAGLGSKGYNSVVANKMLESKLTKCEQDLDERKSQINDLKVVLQDSAKRENDLHEENEKLKEQIEILERFPPGAGGSDANTVRELQQARIEIDELQKAKADLEKMLQVLRRHIASEKSSDATDGPEMDDTMLTKLKQYDSTLEKNAKLNTDIALTRQERDRLKDEVARLEKELSNFNDDFFDEIEDLKYNYAEAVKRNVLYEEQLRNLSKQYGAEVIIQDNDATKS